MLQDHSEKDLDMRLTLLQYKNEGFLVSNICFHQQDHLRYLTQVVQSSVVDKSSVPSKISIFGRRDFCPLVDQSSMVDESSFSQSFIHVNKFLPQNIRLMLLSLFSLNSLLTSCTTNRKGQKVSLFWILNDRFISSHFIIISLVFRKVFSS